MKHKDSIMSNLESVIAPALWRKNLDIKDVVNLPVYGEVKFCDGQLVYAVPQELPKDYDCALATDNDHHRVISLYIGKKGFGIVFHCAIEHDPISGTVKEKWYNYRGARNHGKNFIYGGNWTTPPEGNPKGGYASMEEALAHAPDELKGWDDFAVRSRLRAMQASLQASAAINGAADRETVAALYAGGASCKEVSANRGGFRRALAQNHAVNAIRALLNCGSELNRSDLARVERAVKSL